MIEPYFETDSGTLYNADCYEIVDEIIDMYPDISLVLTDPPYFMPNLGKRGIKKKGVIKKLKYHIQLDDENMNKGFDMNILDKFDNWFCFCSLKQVPELMKKAMVRNWMLLTWSKTNPAPLTTNTYLPDTEYMIHSFSKNRLFGNYSDKARAIISSTYKNKFDHPAVKPFFVLNKLLTLGSKEGETVLDLFSGSGSLAIACDRQKRRWVCIEKEQRYCEMTKQRILAEGLQLKLF